MNKIQLLNNYNYQYNKIKNKEEILELLKKYRSILKNPIYDYLNSAINLDVSILSNDLDITEREVLSELAIYNEIGKYNIYNRVVNLLNDKTEFGKLIIDDRNGTLEIRDLKTMIKIFDFHYSDVIVNQIPLMDNVTSKIGNITIKKYLEKRNATKEDIELLKELLQEEKEKKNPYGEKNNSSMAYSWWKYHQDRIYGYKTFLNDINKEINLDSNKKRLIDLTRYTSSVLYNELNLNSNSFTSNNVEMDILNIQKYEKEQACFKYGYINETKEILVLKKTQVKRLPNLVITNKAEYM